VRDGPPSQRRCPSKPALSCRAPCCPSLSSRHLCFGLAPRFPSPPVPYSSAPPDRAPASSTLLTCSSRSSLPGALVGWAPVRFGTKRSAVALRRGLRAIRSRSGGQVGSGGCGQPCLRGAVGGKKDSGRKDAHRVASLFDAVTPKTYDASAEVSALERKPYSPNRVQ
jgi:hypothetical protein